MLTHDQLAHFREQGYLVIGHAVPPDLFESLRQATARVTARTRQGDWPHNRDAGDGDIWGVSHLLHPDLGESIFARYMAAPEVLEVGRSARGSPRQKSTPTCCIGGSIIPQRTCLSRNFRTRRIAHNTDLTAKKRKL